MLATSAQAVNTSTLSKKAKAMYTLYKTGRLTKEQVAAAVEKGLITAYEYEVITGEKYVDPDIVIIEPSTEEE